MWEVVLTKIGTLLIDNGMDRAGKWFKQRSKKKQPSVEELKKQTQILFIDDESFEQRLYAIRDAGWAVRQINDVSNLDCEEIRISNIIFMDYKGVGKIMTPSEEGIGLLKQLKKKYPEKFFIFYSGYAGFIPGSEVHNIADAWIPKHSDVIVYIDQIEEAAKKIYVQ